ncbi:MAG: DUF2892 domain-containing protein [Gemmatimonadota bacterium]
MALVRNVGGWDRAIRVIVGLALIVLVISQDLAGFWGGIAFLVGGVALITGVVRYCPVNKMLGLNSCSVEPPAASDS